jgi:hypothetical protein
MQQMRFFQSLSVIFFQDQKRDIFVFLFSSQRTLIENVDKNVTKAIGEEFEDIFFRADRIKKRLDKNVI